MMDDWTRGFGVEKNKKKQLNRTSEPEKLKGPTNWGPQPEETENGPTFPKFIGRS